MESLYVLKDLQREDLKQALLIWNEVVEEGNAFPQDACMDVPEAWDFFRDQTCTRILRDEQKGEVLGLYILHPNNVGRCGHICNASYAVKKEVQNQGIGTILVKDCMERAKQEGFSILQFNAVVEDNAAALHLYEKLGFIQLGRIEKGFLKKDGTYAGIIPHYISL